MYRIPLSKGKYAIVDREIFDKLSKRKWHFNGRYAARHIKGNNRKLLLMHRVILETSKGLETDHINGDKLDNRRSNLRECTVSQNAMNKKVNLSSSSGYKGVQSFKEGSGKKWRVQIILNNKKIELGYFNDKEEAALAYNEAAKKYFGEFACLNQLRLI